MPQWNDRWPSLGSQTNANNNDKCEWSLDSCSLSMTECDRQGEVSGPTLHITGKVILIALLVPSLSAALASLSTSDCRSRQHRPPFRVLAASITCSTSLAVVIITCYSFLASIALASVIFN